MRCSSAFHCGASEGRTSPMISRQAGRDAWTWRRASSRCRCPFFSRSSPANPSTASSGRIPSFARSAHGPGANTSVSTALRRHATSSLPASAPAFRARSRVTAVTRRASRSVHLKPREIAGGKHLAIDVVSANADQAGNPVQTPEPGGQEPARKQVVAPNRVVRLRCPPATPAGSGCAAWSCPTRGSVPSGTPAEHPPPAPPGPVPASASR